jgi:hypothetical protein
VRGLALMCAVGVILLSGGCGSSAADPGATVRVSGQVARSCVGPIVVNRPRNCSDRAVFERGGKRVTVHGRFSVELTPGTYRVSVDTCADQQTLTVKHAITALKLMPRCAVPL